MEEGIRMVDLWTARYCWARVDFSAEPNETLFSANRTEDLPIAERCFRPVGDKRGQASHGGGR